MSQYTSEYLKEKLQKEFNPIHLVRSAYIFAHSHTAYPLKLSVTIKIAIKHAASA